MQLGVARSLERWAATWARRRQGADAHAIALKRRRIYILPTRFGVVFAAMVFAMLLGSLNYAASLGFALTFLLAGLCLVVMHHCHNNLLGATIKFVGAAPVFAGRARRIQGRRRQRRRGSALRDRAQVPRAHGGARRRRGRRNGDAAASGYRRSTAAGSPSSGFGSRHAIPRACSAPGRGCTWTRAASCTRAPPIPAGRCPTARAAASAGDRTLATTISPACDPQHRATRRSASRGKRTRATINCC